MKLLIFYVLLVIINEAANEIINPMKDPHICGRPICDIENEKFKFEKSTAYKYEYSAHFKTLFQGTDENVSEYYVYGVAELHFPSQCQGVLKLSEVKLRDTPAVEEDANETDDVPYYDYEELNNLHPHSSKFSEALEAHELRFAFHDGLIQEVCPNPEDSVWTVNMKRGILSSFQNTMVRFDIDHNTTESDVSGKCDVSYKLLGTSGTKLLIQKDKDISSCKNRYRYNSFIQKTSYEFRKNYVEWWPILETKSFCNVSVDHYVYSDIECHEHNLFIPFSNSESGAVTDSVIKLKLTDEYESHAYSDDDSNSIEKRQSLLYDHSHSPKPTHGEIKASREYLKKMCQLGFPNIQREFPDAFIKFLAASKQLSLSVLQQLLARARSICPNGKKHVLESLPYIGSSASVILMKNLIIERSIPEDMVQDWMKSIFYMQHPDDDVIDAMFSLIEQYEVNKDPTFILIPTSVVHTFCVNHDECEQRSSVMRIIKFLEENVGKHLEADLSDRKTFQALIVSMKGLGNIGKTSRSFENNLKQLIVDGTQVLDIRLQAISIFRRLNCEQSRDFFIDMYKNGTENVEVRIASYLQSMKCPDYLSIKTIKTVLKEEQVNQVGSFVWSHLHNLAKSSSPTQVELQALLADNKLDDKFNLDIRKFSRNYEYSLFFDEYNFGLTADSNLIFDTNSYLPRSLFFNGTVNLFGESINAFEMNIRMQGFENYIESIFGHAGPLNYEKISSLLTSFVKYIKQLLNFNEDFYILEKFTGRGKRAVAQQIAEELENIKKIPYKFSYDHNHPHGYLEYKVFGNDINIFMFDGYGEFNEQLKKLISFDSFREILSGKEEVFTKSGTLLDVSYTSPMCSGVPLSLTAFGASSFDLRFSGSVKNKNVFESKTLDFYGKLKPSLSMEFTGKMQADLFYAATEIKVKNNLYSNHAVETDLKIDGTNQMSLKVKLPQERNEIFSIRSKIGVNRNGRDYNIGGILSRYDNTTCTWPSIDDALGLKICIDYSVPDVSDTAKSYPSLILSGPIKFDIHLDKTDPTAKLFNFEYQFIRNETESQRLFKFETPGSQIPRVFLTNITSHDETHNFLMGFQNGNVTHSAQGLYKNHKKEKVLNLALSIDGKKQFSLEMGVNRTDIKNGGVYYPSFMLTISDQQVAGMVGYIKLTEKKNISQYDVNLEFQTKKMQSTLNGMIIKSETSTDSKLTLGYKFSGSKHETIDLETTLANRSQRMRGKYEYDGSMKLVTSTYSHLNFASKFKFISAMGHMECIVDINNAPNLMDPAYTLSTKLMFARSSERRETKTTASLEVTRPKSVTDYKLYLKHEEKVKNGTEHDVILVIRYAPSKELTGTASVLIPRGSLFAIDSAFNLTAHDMGSFTAAVKIQERVRNEYVLDLKGEWFGGQTLQLRGIYQDKTSNVKKFYHLKMNIQSKAFDDVNLILKYSHDHYEFKVDVHTELMGNVYAFKLKNADLSPTESKILTEIKWKEQIYSLTAHSLSDSIKKTTIELHLDKFRDIYIQIWGQSEEMQKQLGIELKWDANRDPSQKIIFSCAYNKPEASMYNGNFLVSYPERSLSAQFDVANGKPDYRGKLRVSWSSNDAITLSYSVGSEISEKKKFWIKLNAETPFEGWRQNSIEGSFLNDKNNYLMNSTVSWANNQLIGFEVQLDYLIAEMSVSCEFKSDLKSTVEDIPAITTSFKHFQNNEKIDTEISVKHKKPGNYLDRLFYVKSKWEFGSTNIERHISGSVALKSPFEGYTSGILFIKFSLNDGENKAVKGLIDFEIESRNYAMTIDGYLKKFTDNMLSINITTPIETFKYVNGRFGINEKDRHVVADIKTPTKALGVELMFIFESVTDFDVKFYLATPLEAFEKILVIGKLNEDAVHFEGGWNKLTLGFIGVWRFTSYKDFEYSYQVLTPLEKYERNGVVARIIYGNIQQFDIDLSFKVSNFKLGIQLYGEPKGELSRTATQLKDTISDYDDSFEDYEDDEEEDFLEQNLFSLLANFKIDTFIWKTIKGDIDIEESGSRYHCFGNVYIPQGQIYVKNVLQMPHYFYLVNRLEILTPFSNYDKIQSVYRSLLEPPEKYNLGLEVTIFNKTVPRNYGFKIKYLNTTEEITDEIELKSHNLTLTLITPVAPAPITCNTLIQVEGASSFKANLSIDGLATKLQLFGLLQKHNDNFDTSFGIFLASPVVPHYFCKIFSKRKFSDEKNLFEIGFNLNENFVESNLMTEIVWAEADEKSLDASILLKNDILPIRTLQTSLTVKKGTNPKLQLMVSYQDSDEFSDEMKILIQKKGLKFNGEISIPIEDYRNVSFAGNLTEQSRPGAYKVDGQVIRNLVACDFEGTAFFLRNLPINVDLIFKSTPEAQLTYKLTKDEYKTSLKAKLTQNDEFFELDVDTLMKNKLDWGYNVKTSSSKPDLTDMKLSTHTSPISKNSFESGVEMTSPWKWLALDHVNLSSIILLTQNNGDINMTYQIWKYTGNSSFIWKWILFEDMQFKIFTYSEANAVGKTFRTGLKYLKSLKNLLIEGEMDINSLWKLSAFGNLNTNSIKDFNFEAGAQLPVPIDSSHKVNGKVLAEFAPRTNKADVSWEIAYKNEKDLNKFELKGLYKNDTDMKGMLRLDWGADLDPSVLEGNLGLARVGKKQDLTLDITTPLYLDEKTIILVGNYDHEHIYHIVKANLNVPESKQLVTTEIAYSDLSNMKGKANFSMPSLNLTWLHVDFDFETPENENVKYIKASWPNNQAILDSKSTLVTKGAQTDWQGTIKAEIPLQTSHQAHIVYGLSERPKVTNGQIQVEYNKKNVLTTTYTCKTEKTDINSKKVIDLSLQNELMPIGMHYSHSNEFLKDLNEYLDIKHGEVFDLKKKDRFNITSELTVKTRDDGHDYEFVAIHPNRTIKVTTKSEIKDNESNHRAKVELAPSVWLGYHLDITNLSQSDNDTQKFKFMLTYPSRNLTARGWYSLTEDSFDSDASLEWTTKTPEVVEQPQPQDEDGYDDYEETKTEEEKPVPKVMRAGFHWKAHELRGTDLNNHTAIFVIKHPTFEKDVSFKGSFYRNIVDILKADFSLEYADEPEHLVQFDVSVRNLTDEVGYRNFTFSINGLHDVSDLDLNFDGSIGIQPKLYELISVGHYKRSYLSLQELDMSGFINIEKKKFKLYRSTPHKIIHLYGAANGAFPRYGVQGIYEDSPEIESEGDFYIDLVEKLLRGEVNLTSDGSQNLQIYGAIPDTRSASFEIWRNYEEIQIRDISYFLKMNHSRLISSKFIWRPKMKAEMKEKLKDFLATRYNAVSEEIDYWVKTIYTETADTVNDVWQDGKEYTKGFLDDLSGLQDIEEDIQKLRVFLNDSYNADDFYVQSFVNFTMTVLDEMAIKDRIESIPRIIKEVWQALGESGEALRKSILWLIETFKTSYKTSLDIISQLLQGKSFEYLGKFMETLIEKYDRFVKNLHLSFIKYVEKVWTNLMNVMTNYWNKMLKNIEPAAIKFIHYMDTAVWNVCRELFDFLYDRTNEIMDSPYFHQVSDLTQDLDRLYHDLMTNDIFTNIKKYSVLTYRFLKEKIFNILPFGREIQEISSELMAELQQLQKIESIQYAMKRWEEIQGKIIWLANEFQLERRLNSLAYIIKKKLSKITQNALETDDRYREAKTKFIFDPDVGVIELEQKLPMSWHAFNETPRIEEIPEYRMLNDLQAFFTEKRNTSFSSFYYELKPYMELRNFLPPFKAHALIVGSQHFITFDGNFVSIPNECYHETNQSLDLHNQCSYLLANDYVNEDFSLILKPSLVQKSGKTFLTKKLLLITDQQTVEIDTGSANEKIKIGNNPTTSLPTAFGDVLIHLDANIVTVESRKGFILKCNLDFDVCSLDVSGWYFGKLAGILGSMNNEVYDDFSTSSNLIVKNENEMIDSWKLQSCEQTKMTTPSPPLDEELISLCDSFFKRKTSFFTTCFDTIDPFAYYQICLSLTGSEKYKISNTEMKKGACTAAIAYIEACDSRKIPLRVPDVCIQ